MLFKAHSYKIILGTTKFTSRWSIARSIVLSAVNASYLNLKMRNTGISNLMGLYIKKQCSCRFSLCILFSTFHCYCTSIVIRTDCILFMGFFTTVKEENQKINFPCLTIHRKQSRFPIDIYRKPTTTDTIIVNDSSHPREHKMAAIHYLHNWIITYEMSPEKTERKTDYTANPK